MIVGSYGDVSFQVSSSQVETFKNLKWTSAATYQLHKVHGNKAIPEFTGYDGDKITLEIELSAFLGVNPKSEMDKLVEIMESKTAHPFVLGTDVYGAKWLLTNVSRDFDRVYRDGALLSAKVQITLIEQVDLTKEG